MKWPGCVRFNNNSLKFYPGRSSISGAINSSGGSAAVVVVNIRRSSSIHRSNNYGSNAIYIINSE